MLKVVLAATLYLVCPSIQILFNVHFKSNSVNKNIIFVIASFRIMKIVDASVELSLRI